MPQHQTTIHSRPGSNASVNITHSQTSTAKVYKVLPANLAAIKSQSKVQVINATNVQQQAHTSMPSTPTTPNTPNVFHSQFSNSSDLLE